ncbi:MAG TPA: DUF308 domain-containing protein [Candidatus Angelobacter sp.]|nr:DUF308 domain-containing protein [Candidatus Angelobacter sp.]
MINREARARTWSRLLGILLILLGVVAIISPVFAMATLIKAMGWLLLIAAIEQAIDAFQSREEGGVFWRGLLAVVYGVAGCILLLRPASGAAAGTVIIAILFFLDGITEIGLGIQSRHESGTRGWLLAGGTMSLLFGGIILYRFPIGAMWTIGLFVGIRLVVKGITQIVRVSAAMHSGAGRGYLDRAA